MIRLFLRGLLQVALVSAQVHHIAHQRWVGAGITAFLISWVWSHNVRSVAFGSERDRIVYALGAATGAIVGMGLSIWMYAEVVG